MSEKVVLYIEDNSHNRRIVRKILGMQGYHVIEAEDGLLGYNMIRDRRPPLVLLDISLPTMDGIEIVAVSLCALSISVIATLYPAALGSRLQPVEGLRYEQ